MNCHIDTATCADYAGVFENSLVKYRPRFLSPTDSTYDLADHEHVG